MRRRLAHRLQFPERGSARHVFHAAVRRDHESIRGDMFQPVADALGHHGDRLDLGDPTIEPAAVVADRIRNGLKHVAPERLVVAPDCGMKYMPRHVAFGKLKAMCEAAAMVRKEIG